jgi:hypothetical protein
MNPNSNCEIQDKTMPNYNICKACGKSPAPHRTFVRFANLNITIFFTCSKECMLNIIQTELAKGLECIKDSIVKHALAECNCDSIQTDKYTE